MSKYTPGPWAKSILGGGKGGPNSYNIETADSDGTDLRATLIARVVGRMDGAAGANACLIAAAPELLAAVEELFTVGSVALGKLDDDLEPLAAALGRARVVLAKVRGDR